MPIHDWTRVDAGIFHDFHHGWIEEIKRALNARLPDDYYALAEQHAAGFGPDVLTLQGSTGAAANGSTPLPGAATPPASGSVGLMLAPPKVRMQVETAMQFYRRKKKVVTVRHVSGDEIVAIVELVSPGNKTGRNAFRALVEKACYLLEHQIHLLIVDLFPPMKRDPQGVHAAIWEEITDEPLSSPDKPLTLVAYESDLMVKAYIEPVAVGDVLPDMPLFLEPGAHVLVPLEATYQAAWAAVPRRWRTVLEPAAG